MGHLVTAVIISPQFLMRIERDRPEEAKPYLIDDYELATRLSFFLWSRPPDAELLELARKQELNTPEVLERMTRQMLRDERSGALVEHFFGQWLSLREIRTHQPDAKVFPEFDDDLRSAIGHEVKLTLTEIVQQDRPVTEVIDTNYTYLNERLAKHYGLRRLARARYRGRRHGAGYAGSAAWWSAHFGRIVDAASGSVAHQCTTPWQFYCVADSRYASAATAAWRATTGGSGYRWEIKITSRVAGTASQQA